MQDQVKKFQRVADELPMLQAIERDVKEYQTRLEKDVTEQVRKLSGATTNALDGKIRQIDENILRLDKEQGKTSFVSLLRQGGEGFPELAKQTLTRAIELELLRQERQYLAEFRKYADALLNRQGAQQKLEQLRQLDVKTDASYQTAKKLEERFEASAGVLTKVLMKIPYTSAHSQRAQLKKQAAQAKEQYDAAHRDYLAHQSYIKQLPTLTGPGSFQIDESRLSTVMAPLSDAIGQAADRAAKNYAWQLYSAVLPFLNTAIGLLVGWWLIPAAIRTMFYFVFAPLSARRPPIVIDPISTGSVYLSSIDRSPPGTGSVVSGVSRKVTLTPNQVLLMHPDYSQSLPSGVKADTKVLFDWSCPIASIAAHLWMLKRLRTSQPVEIVVSSTKDPLDELAVLDVPNGAAFILQPRSLVGVVYDEDTPLHIRRHWRLGNLHAWLTLQLRYLSFQGPVTLVIKGCRGVCLERAGTGRTISQAATLGFSANTVYSTSRAEPFVPYLTGNQALLQDQFMGADSYYLYEEVPRVNAANKTQRNPFEVLIDAGLKAFGI